jgi:hypothetical protein
MAGKAEARGRRATQNAGGDAGGPVNLLLDTDIDDDTDMYLNESLALSVSRRHRLRHSSVELKACPFSQYSTFFSFSLHSLAKTLWILDFPSLRGLVMY